MPNAILRRKVRDALVRLGSRVLLDDGRVREYTAAEFEGRDAAINVTTFNSLAETRRVLGDCCSIDLRTQVDVVVMLPLRRSCEEDVEAIEVDVFRLLAPLLGCRDLELESLTTSPHQLETECPVTARIMRFNATAHFNPAEPPYE